MCEFMFLSNLSYQKVPISALFPSVAITGDGADAVCLRRRHKRFVYIGYASIICSLHEDLMKIRG